MKFRNGDRDIIVFVLHENKHFFYDELICKPIKYLSYDNAI